MITIKTQSPTLLQTRGLEIQEISGYCYLAKWYLPQNQKLDFQDSRLLFDSDEVSIGSTLGMIFDRVSHCPCESPSLRKK